MELKTRIEGKENRRRLPKFGIFFDFNKIGITEKFNRRK